MKKPSFKISGNLVFTAVIVSICLILYLRTETTPPAQEYVPTPTPSPSPYTTSNEFLNHLSECGLIANRSDPNQHVYTLSKPGEESLDFQLVLSVKDNHVTAFTMMVPYLSIIELPKDATVIERALYERQTRAKQDQAVAMRECFFCLCSAMDPTEQIPFSKRIAWYNDLLNTQSTAKAFHDTYHSYTADAFILQENPVMIVLSITQNTKTQ